MQAVEMSFRVYKLTFWEKREELGYFGGAQSRADADVAWRSDWAPHGMSIWEKDSLGKTQDILEALHLLAGLGIPQYPSSIVVCMSTSVS